MRVSESQIMKFVSGLVAKAGADRGINAKYKDFNSLTGFLCWLDSCPYNSRLITI
jgi:hypothetical protein